MGTKNRWSRVVLGYSGLVPNQWCEFSFGIDWDTDESALSVPDFALVGIDLRAPDGSSLDFDQVPGLDRTLLDPHGAWIAGPALHPGEVVAPRTAMVRVAFALPAPAAEVAITIRSWRNTHAFVIGRPRLLQVAREAISGMAAPFRRRRPLAQNPEWFDYVLITGRPLILRGQIFAPAPGEHSALARIVYRDVNGSEIAPPYPGTILIPAVGAFVNIPAQQQARRFTLDLAPPAEAARVSVGFATWDGTVTEVELLDAPEVSLEDGLRLESLSGEDRLSSSEFLANLAERLGVSPAAVLHWCPPPRVAEAVPPILARAQALRYGEQQSRPAGTPLRLAQCPDWPLPEDPDWTEDPFRSVAWRIAYQSLSWLWPMAGSHGDAEAALRLALSWSAVNPWGEPADALALHPAALAMRAEVFVRLLGRCSGATATHAVALTGEMVRHGFALAEIVGQNALARSILQLEAASALLCIARALPGLPLSGHWLGLATNGIADCVERLTHLNEGIADPSPHRRLELINLGAALAGALKDQPLGGMITRRVEAALPGLSELLDPGSRLPPFGDTPHGEDHAGWIGRLRAAFAAGRDLVAERRGGRTASPPPAEPSAGFLIRRQDSTGRNWGHFACTYATRGQGHRDVTSFVYATEGIRWIVEAGGSTLVETGAARHHLASAEAHNVAIPDGREPGSGEAWLAGSTPLDGATAYEIGTNVHGPMYAHARILVILHDLSGLIVLDRFAAAVRPVTVEGLIHLAPDVLAAIASPRRAMAQYGRSRLAFTPVVPSGRAAGLSIVNGRYDRPGKMQGLVSQQPGILAPASVLRYAFAGTDRVCGGLLIASDTTAEGRLATLLAGRTLSPILAGPDS
ncbi:heparinase II/III family protein [Methylobacterium sp.]|uniref:heparinase II/III domain-containing protein n=1 Tax=Methylobacterium sp. TaxID=409 RepID=UPI0025DD552F|nr:heparinase II/III family protein [Methylobacterium sp.]